MNSKAYFHAKDQNISKSKTGTKVCSLAAVHGPALMY